MQQYSILLSEYMILGIIALTILLSFLADIPHNNPKLFLQLSIIILLWFVINIINITYKAIKGVRTVNIIHIYGFIFTLLLVYGLVYYALLNYDNTTFGGKEINTDKFKPSEITTYFDMIYFAMTTFTTVGYGDIYPVNRIAKFIVMTQYIIGFTLISILLSKALK